MNYKTNFHIVIYFNQLSNASDVTKPQSSAFRVKIFNELFIILMEALQTRSTSERSR